VPHAPAFGGRVKRMKASKAAVAKFCMPHGGAAVVHFVRNALAHAGRQGRVASAFIATAFAQDDLQSTNPLDASRRDQVPNPKSLPNEEATICLAGVIIIQ
jgi:hypothetical protein